MKRILILLSSALILWAQSDPFKGVPPHDVPHCSPTGKGMAAARCGCTGMVQEVHEAIALSCWRKAGVEDRPDSWLLNHPPQVVLDCMGTEHKDHCEIVADALFEQTKWGIRIDPSKQCRTACQPERCGCADSACKAHGGGGGY